jgi:coenzyme F420-0:L-glutamate ligase
MLTLVPFKAERKSGRFDLPELVERTTEGELQDGDVLVVSSKFAAISEGRVVELETVRPGARAADLGRRFRMPSELCELVLRESDEVIGGVPGFILTLWKGLLTPNAGIDRSNVEPGKVVLYPSDPLASAVRVSDRIRKSKGLLVGVVVSDSRLMPTRAGTVGVALASVGVRGVKDLRGHPDLFGTPLKVTRMAYADGLCTAAQLVMGEADESTPIALVRGAKEAVEEGAMFPPESFAIPPEQCVYMTSFRRLGSEGPSQV